MVGLTLAAQLHSGLEAVRGLSDPLLVVKALTSLIAAGENLGLTFQQGTDFGEFADYRRKLRASEPSPMFDTNIDSNLARSGFWMTATDTAGSVVAMQAFRLDDALPSLAEWALGWMMGLYARRNEMIVPRHYLPPAHSLTRLIRGRIVYQGEFWIDKHCRGLFDIFPRLGNLLALIKWHPEAVWALTSAAMATRGHMVRAGFGHIEPSFLTWHWKPEGADLDEWVAVATKRDLEFMVAEMTDVTKARRPLSSSP